MTHQVYQVLVVDDDESVRESITGFLREDAGFSYAVKTAATGEEALEIIQHEHGSFDVAIVDQYLGEGISGIEVLRQIKAIYPDIQVIIFTAYEMDSVIEIFEAGAYRFIAKPPNPKELSATIRFAAEHGYSRRERKLLAALQQVSEAINSSLELHKILQLSCESAVKLFAVDHSALVRFAKDRQTGEIVAEYPAKMIYPNDGSRNMTIQVAGVPAEERLLHEQEIINIRDVAQATDLGTLREELLSNNIQSLLVIPVIIDNQVIASFSLDSIGKQRTFSEYEIEACRNLANQVGNAIRNSQLFAAEALKRKEAETLRESIMSITKTLDRSEIFRIILSELKSVVPYDYASIQMLSGEKLEVINSSGFPNESEIIGLSFLLEGNNPNREVIRTREPYIVEDALEKYKGFGEFPFTKTQIRSWLGVPMLLDNRVIGMITLDKREPAFFTSAHARLALTFATQAALVIHKTELLEEAKQNGAYIQSLFESSGKVIEPLDMFEGLEKIVRKIMETALKVTGAWRAIFFLVDEGANPRVLAATGYDCPDNLVSPGRDLDLIRESGITWKVLKSCEARFIPDLNAEADEVNPKLIQDGIMAAACLPLRWAGRKIGALWIQYRSEHPFSDTEKQALQIYADQSAIAYENARRIKDLNALSDAAAEMAAATDDPALVLDAFFKSAKKLTRADAYLYWDYNYHGNSFLPHNLVSDYFTEEDVETFKREEGSTGKATAKILTESYFECSNISEAVDELFGEPIRKLLQSRKIKSLQGICLENKGEQLGVLFVDYLHVRNFTPEDKALLQSLAETGAMALKQARLLAQLHRARDLANLVARFSALNNDFKTTWELIEKEARATLGCDAITLYQYDEKKEDFEYPPLMAGVEYPERAVLSPSLPTNSIVREIWNSSEPIVAIDDIGSHPLTSPARKRRRFTQDENIKALVAMHLEADNRKVGVIFINYRKKRRFSEEEIRNIQMFGNQLAIAIRYVRRYADLKKIKALVGTKTALEWFEVISSSWGHEVKNNALSVARRAELIQMHLNKQNFDEASAELNRLNMTIEELMRNAMLAPVYKDSEFSSVGINDLIQSGIKHLRNHKPYSSTLIRLNLEAGLDAKVRVKVHVPWINRVIEMLLKNAIQAMDEAGSPERVIYICTKLSDDKQGVQITIHDTGPGISEDIKRLLFAEKIEKDNRSSGLGIGLMVIKLICDFHSGEISLIENDKPGTSFLICLPVERNMGTI
jgi:GAF domain-containing protein